MLVTMKYSKEMLFLDVRLAMLLTTVTLTDKCFGKHGLAERNATGKCSQMCCSPIFKCDPQRSKDKTAKRLQKHATRKPNFLNHYDVCSNYSTIASSVERSSVQGHLRPGILQATR